MEKLNDFEELSYFIREMAKKACKGDDGVGKLRPIVVYADDFVLQRLEKNFFSINCVSPFDDLRPIVLLGASNDALQVAYNHAQSLWQGAGFVFAVFSDLPLALQFWEVCKVFSSDFCDCVTFAPFGLQNVKMFQKLETLESPLLSETLSVVSITDDAHCVFNRQYETTINWCGNCFLVNVNLFNLLPSYNWLEFDTPFTLSLVYHLAKIGYDFKIYVFEDLQNKTSFRTDNFKDLQKVYRNYPMLFDMKMRINAQILHDIANGYTNYTV